MSKTIYELSDYWKKYGYLEVDYVATKPSLREFGLTSRDVDEIEFANDAEQSRIKRNKLITGIVLWCSYSITFLILFTYMLNDEDSVQDLANRIFFFFTAAFLAFFAPITLFVLGQAVTHAAEKISGFFGYKIIKEKSLPSAEVKKQEYEEYVKRIAKFEYWQLITNPDAWRNPEARPQNLIRDVLALSGYVGGSASYPSAYDTYSYLFENAKGKIFVNIAQGDELISEHYINSIKLDATNEGCKKVIIYTPNVKVAKSAQATIMTMKERNVDIFTAEDFIARI